MPNGGAQENRPESESASDAEAQAVTDRSRPERFSAAPLLGHFGLLYEAPNLIFGFLISFSVPIRSLIAAFISFGQFENSCCHAANVLLARFDFLARLFNALKFYGKLPETENFDSVAE